MMRWTQQLLPPELLGAHIGAPTSHTTHRHRDLAFRAATALFGHLGVEWDLTAASETELRELAEWIRLHRENHDLLHAGELVRMDDLDPTLWVSGVVAPDRGRALYALAFLGRSDAAPLGRITFRGLDDARRYRIIPSSLGGPHAGDRVPPWYEQAITGGLELTGRALRTAGLQAPLSDPDRVWLLQAEAVDRL